jgi:formylglycine-generating enzyme required for sulfatase activity
MRYMFTARNNPSSMYAKPYLDLPRNRTVEIAPGVAMEFVLVLPGSFVMGDGTGPNSSGEGEEYLQKITRPFYLGRYPVSQAQWVAIMSENPAHFKDDDTRPVESVSWEDVRGTGKNKRSFLARLANFSDHTYRLPTNAEWIYAAKGGHLSSLVGGITEVNPTSAANHYPTYAGGDDVNAAAWQELNNKYSSLRSGYRQPNALGLYGMSGNVYEWCDDIIDSGKVYANPPQVSRGTIDIMEKHTGYFRVIRGGSWFFNKWSCRPNSRYAGHPSDRNKDLGLRLVLTLNSAQQME